MLFHFSCKISPSWQRSRKESGSWANQTQIVCFSIISKLKKHLFGQVPSQSAAYSALTRQSAVHKESRLIKGQSKQKLLKLFIKRIYFSPTHLCPVLRPLTNFPAKPDFHLGPYDLVLRFGWENFDTIFFLTKSSPH